MRYRAPLLLACVIVRLTADPTMAVRLKPDTTSAGVYTAEQAAAGEKIYYARCSMCHGDDLAGIERAPALAGSQFLDSWNGKDLRRLLDRVVTMPPGDPKPPTNAEAAELLAFLLRTADMPSGSTALPADRSRLAEIRFERKP